MTDPKFNVEDLVQHRASGRRGIVAVVVQEDRVYRGESAEDDVYRNKYLLSVDFQEAVWAWEHELETAKGPAPVGRYWPTDDTLAPLWEITG